MNELTSRDRELVALGAAMGSNCVPCVEYHIPESRKAGLSDAQIHAAIQHADKIRQVPARKTLQAALRLLPAANGDARSSAGGDRPGCGSSPGTAKAGADQAAGSHEMMTGLMSKMMAACGTHGQGSGAPPPADVGPAGTAAATKECCS